MLPQDSPVCIVSDQRETDSEQVDYKAIIRKISSYSSKSTARHSKPYVQHPKTVYLHS